MIKKKFMLFLLCCLLISIPIISYMEDYSEMSTDDLLIIQKEVTAELNKRLPQNDSFHEGIYIVGQDISSGDYVFTLTKINSSQWKFADLIIRVPLNDGSGDYKRIYMTSLDLKTSCYLHLEDGMRVELNRGSGTLVSAETATWHE